MRQNKLGSLNSVNDYQPFYPKNYRPLPQILSDYANQKLGNSNWTVSVYNQLQSNGSFGWYNQPVNLSNSVYIPSSSNIQIVDKKEEAQKRISKRATSNNSSTSNKENFNQHKRIKITKEKSDISSTFNFPDGGWVCSYCQNYNFCGRLKCNRWYKVKTKEDCDGKPQHIIRKELKNKKKNDENNMNNMNKLKAKIQSNRVQPVQPTHQDTQTSNESWQVYSEKVGDWVCFSWSNLNFSFRKICNRCKLSREESDNQHTSLLSNVTNNSDSLTWFPFSSIPHNFQYSLFEKMNDILTKYKNLKLSNIINRLCKIKWRLYVFISFKAIFIL